MFDHHIGHVILIYQEPLTLLGTWSCLEINVYSWVGVCCDVNFLELPCQCETEKQIVNFSMFIYSRQYTMLHFFRTFNYSSLQFCRVIAILQFQHRNSCCRLDLRANLNHTYEEKYTCCTFGLLKDVINL